LTSFLGQSASELQCLPHPTNYSHQDNLFIILTPHSSSKNNFITDHSSFSSQNNFIIPLVSSNFHLAHLTYLVTIRFFRTPQGYVQKRLGRTEQVLSRSRLSRRTWPNFMKFIPLLHTLRHCSFSFLPIYVTTTFVTCIRFV